MSNSAKIQVCVVYSLIEYVTHVGESLVLVTSTEQRSVQVELSQHAAQRPDVHLQPERQPIHHL